MSTLTSTSTIHRNSVLRLSVTYGLIIGFADEIIYHWIVTNIFYGVPLISVYQYIASGALGASAFAGGIGTALLGVLFHYLISIVIAAIFILSADRIPWLHRHTIAGSLLYGLGVFIVMNSIVTPLSATPPLPAQTTSQLIVMILDHLVVFGLLLGILVWRNANTKKE